MGLVDIYLRTVDGRIIVLKEVKPTVTNTVDELKKLANEHFDPILNVDNMRFLYRSKKIDDTMLQNLLNANKLIFLDLVVVEPKVFRESELDIYLVKNTVAYPTELYPTGHEDNPFMRPGPVINKLNNPNPMSFSSFSQSMKRIEEDIDNSLRIANNNKIPTKRLSLRITEIQRKKEPLKGGSRKTKRRGGRRRQNK